MEYILLGNIAITGTLTACVIINATRRPADKRRSRMHSMPTVLKQ